MIASRQRQGDVMGRRKSTPIQSLTPAENLCANLNSDVKDQVITLAKAVLVMQEKVEQQIPVYKQMPLAQQITVGTGERMLRQNPAVQEFRATVRDYAQALNNLQEILSSQNKTLEGSAIGDLRNRFKVG